MYLLHPGAGLHGHEYSPASEPSNPQSMSPRITLNRSNYPASAKPRPTSFQDTTRPSSIRPARRLSPTRRRTINDRVSFLDPDTDTMSDAGSHTYSDGSEVATTRPRRRRPHRHTSTSYYLAHPAPTLTHKQRLLHIRPKLLLQLQRLSVESRPIPTIDVMSSTTFVPRLAKKFPSLLWRGELGINDVMIVRSDDYSNLDSEKELEDPSVEDTRPDKEILAVISQAAKDVPWAAELCLEDGSKWHATSGAKGILEMVKTEPSTGEKTVARWVPRGTSRRNSLQTPSRGAAEALCDQRYQFSFIDPKTRRHPVLATLTQGMLKVSDTYSPLPGSSEDRQLSSTRTSTDGGNLDHETSADREVLTVDDSQRLLIEVSAIWVVLQRGWCHLFRYEDASPRSSSRSTPTSPTSCSSKVERPRSFSLTPSSAMRHRRNRSDTVTSIPESIDSSTGTVRSRRNVFGRASLNTSAFQYESDEQVPKRALSNGAAFMQKAAARRASRPPSMKMSGSEMESRPGSRSSSPKDSVSGDIADGVRVSHIKAPSPVRQLYPSSVSSSPAKKRRSLPAYNTLEQAPNQTHLETGGQPQSQARTPHEPQRRATRSRTGKPSSLSERKRTGKWSCLFGLFKRHHSTRR